MIMKIPTNNGFYGYDSSVSYLSDGSDIGNVEDMESPSHDGDFSEYLWMENEEEFDKQVMQQLEEEELMEQCIEAMLEDEREIRNIRNQMASTNGGSSDTSAPPRQSWSTNDDVTNHISQSLEGLSVQDDLAKQSTLNPNAAEFVPQQKASECSGSGNVDRSTTS